MKSTDQPIIVEQTFSSSVETVWNAITNVDEMREWFFDNIPDFKPEVGFETQFNVSSGERNFLHQWKIVEVIPLKLIKYSWQYDIYQGKAFVTFQISAKDGQTVLSLTNDVVQDFPQDIPEFKRESCIGGWTYFINQQLVDYLSETKK